MASVIYLRYYHIIKPMTTKNNYESPQVTTVLLSLEACVMQTGSTPGGGWNAPMHDNPLEEDGILLGNTVLL